MIAVKFNSASDAQINSARRLLERLAKRTLNNADMSEAQKLLEETVPNISKRIALIDETKNSPDSKLKNRRVDFTVVHADEVVDDMFPHTILHPTLFRTCILNRTFFHAARPLPVFINQAHIRTKFRERDDRPLNLETEAMEVATIMAPLVAEILEEQRKIEEQDCIPAVLPHPAGLFLGCLRPAHPQGYNYINQKLVHHSEHTSRTPTSNTDKLTPSAVSSEIVLKTFIGKNELRGCNIGLHEKLIQFYRDSWKKQMLRNAAMHYLLGNKRFSNIKAPANGYEYVRNELRKIFESHEWKAYKEHARKHVPQAPLFKIA